MTDSVPAAVFDDPATRPVWAAIDAEPADGWRFYRQNVLRARAALVAGLRADGLTRAAYRFQTRWAQPARELVHVAEHLSGYRGTWAGSAEAVGDPGFLWHPASDDEFADGKSRPVFVLPVWDFALSVTAIDIVAWSPLSPARWARATGLADMLGESRMHDAQLSGAALRIYPTPTAWLAGEADWPGICILHNGREGGRNAWRMLEGIETLICDDADHAAAVHRMTRRTERRALAKIRHCREQQQIEEGAAAVA